MVGLHNFNSCKYFNYFSDEKEPESKVTSQISHKRKFVALEGCESSKTTSVQSRKVGAKGRQVKSEKKEAGQR